MSSVYKKIPGWEVAPYFTCLWFDPCQVRLFTISSLNFQHKGKVRKTSRQVRLLCSRARHL